MAKSKDGVIGLIGGDAERLKLSEKEKGERLFASGDRPKRKPRESGAPLPLGEVPSESDDIEAGDSVLGYIDPEIIVPWGNKDRTLEEMEDDEEFHKLVERIRSAGGNIQPIKVRPLSPNKGSDGEKYEEIFGFKRLNACKRLGIPVLAIIEKMTDKEAWRQMVGENDGRSDVSAWTKALSWKNALDKKLVSSVDELAVEEKKDVRTIDQYLRVVDIMDPEIINHVKLHKLGIQALLEIRSALLRFSDDEKKRREFVDRVIENADKIEAGRASPNLFAGIADVVSGDAAKSVGKERTFTAGGNKLFSVKPAKQGYSVKMHFAASKHIPSDEIEEVLRRHLESKGLKLDEK